MLVPKRDLRFAAALADALGKLDHLVDGLLAVEAHHVVLKQLADVGLGLAERAATVEVRWPSGRTDAYHDLTAGAGYSLREGDREPAPLPGFNR